LIRLAFPYKFPTDLSQFLGHEQAGDALKDDEERARKREDCSPPRRYTKEERVHGLGKEVETDEEKKWLDGDLQSRQERGTPKELQCSMNEGLEEYEQRKEEERGLGQSR
jgi:hypothetical protein